MNKMEAVRTWVDGFNAVNSSLIERAFANRIEEWLELTPIVPGDSVYYKNDCVEVLDVNHEDDLITLDLIDNDTNENIIVQKYEVEDIFDSWLPMWGTLWTFSCNLDEEWAKENPSLLSKCGFRIFEDQETGEIYLGIDGAGYNFYDAHWIPLYEARGLQWHTTN